MSRAHRDHSRPLLHADSHGPRSGERTICGAKSDGGLVWGEFFQPKDLRAEARARGLKPCGRCLAELELSSSSRWQPKKLRDTWS